MRPLVSIITPMFNSEAFISDTIDSVINQTYKNWELLLIDDCSTDSTIQIVNPFLSKHQNIKLLKNNKNLGAAISRNKGIEAANGKYIAFLDADDLWKPKKLEIQIEFMETHNCDICFSNYEQIDETGKALNKLVKALPELTYKKYLKSNYIGNLTGVYNVDVLGKIKAPNLRKRQDWALWLLAIKKSKKPAIGISQSLAYYRIRKNSMSSNKIHLLKHNYLVYRKGLGFSILKSAYYMLIFLNEHFFVKSKQLVSTNTI
ncbi:glycosyltransferase family 2 protein [Mariniflexile litorale]|uniref:Glycosyltransferase family 2 protein n=1 Tax=Mariniflexile litorale TaxID=3045158 RepID=A0AAU7EHZ9_9FLAO|nr:glycosyltransferase family 2 protein [Mariniflexile sp. KMM 9835]MDQ8211348.1 glycosyltransferase family 2 protein [Mariniflexile sp. KMM 9835]